MRDHSHKDDSHKPNFLPMLQGIQAVMAHGAAKYGEGNWRTSIGTDKHDSFRQRLLAAAIRHIIAADDLDADSGLPHVDHALACLYMAREYRR
jgi:hypothetical protein